MRKIVMLLLVVIISSGALIMNKGTNIKKVEDNKSTNKQITETIAEDQEKDKQHEEKENTIIEKEKETTSPKKENKTEIKKETNNERTTHKNNEPTQNNPSTSNQSSGNNESGVIDQNGNVHQEEKVIVIEKTPWEKLNISEYDWYHKPVHNWMRVDYNVSNCNTVSNCEALCMKDAEELAYTENVSCIQVYSYSGNYLGEMLKRD